MDSISTEYAKLVIADTILAKAVGMAELTEMARIEKRTREYLEATWGKRSSAATRKGTKMAKALKAPTTIAQAVDATMGKWPKDAKATYAAEIKRVYKLGRIAAWKVLTGRTKGDLTYFGPKPQTPVVKAEKTPKFKVNPTFSLVDEKAVEALVSHQLYWMGEHYDEAVSAAVAETTRTVMAEAGKNSKAAAKLMKEKLATALSHVVLPSGYRGTAKSYLQGVTANALTTARVVGQMHSFIETGVKTYRINATGDSRMCARCGHMDGKTFTVKQATKQIKSLLKANTPAQIKKIHPWLSLEQLQTISPNAGPQETTKESDALAAAGQSLPPFHFKCRCTTDVDYSSYSFDELLSA